MRIRLIAAAVMTSLAVFAITVLGQQRAAAPAGPSTGVRLVDLGAISKSSTRLKRDLESMKADYEATAVEMRKEGEEGNRMTEKVRAMPPGPERKLKEQEILQKRAEYERHGKRVTDEFKEREAKVVYGLNRELKEEVARFAKSNGVDLVLRYEPTPTEMTDPRAILQEIQKPIVYQRDSDITPPVLDSLNRRTPVGNSTARPPAGPTGPAKR